MRSADRAPRELREITFLRHYTRHAEGAVLSCFGHTKVLCTASIIEGVPRFLKGSGKGWLTAEYGMLPRATHLRSDREAAKGKQGGRTLEIQRLIGRALRNAIDLTKIGENTIYIDCDVLQADGGTRTAAITGSCIALYDAAQHLKTVLKLSQTPFKQFIAAVSVGIYRGFPLLDLDYTEDTGAETDMNVVMTDSNEFIEIQGTAEKRAFSREELNTLLALAEDGIKTLVSMQRRVLGLEP